MTCVKSQRYGTLCSEVVAFEGCHTPLTAVAPRLHTVTNKPYVNEVTLNEQN